MDQSKLLHNISHLFERLYKWAVWKLFSCNQCMYQSKLLHNNYTTAYLRDYINELSENCLHEVNVHIRPVACYSLCMLSFCVTGSVVNKAYHNYFLPTWASLTINICFLRHWQMCPPFVCHISCWHYLHMLAGLCFP